MNKEKIIELLDEEKNAEQFASYIIGLELKKKDGKVVNYWIQGRTEDEMADLFKRVAKDGLVFDGKHITLQSTGISYDYIAYKNKMLLAYPESKVDVSLVYEGDEFNVAKESGSVIYTHNIKEPFGRETKDIVGGYCIIRNKRGEFLTILNKEEIDKHRKVAKTDFIWNQWFAEMSLKTVIKKAVKLHFDDVYKNIEDLDNENYDLDNSLDIDIEHKTAIDEMKTVKELTEYFTKHQDNKDVVKYIAKKKEELEKYENN